MLKFVSAITLLILGSSAAVADNDAPSSCKLPQNLVASIQRTLFAVVRLNNGGIFSPNRMWSAVVDREGHLCSVEVVGDAWPGSRAIAIAKASTANDFSNSGLALSTANLYSATQPGGSLYGLNNSNPFNPDFLRQGTGVGQVPGGIITFGGGLALYLGGQVIGGLGVSGDSSCADHAIAYRMRRLAHLDGIPAGVGFNGTDNIDYLATGEAPNGFKQPHCFPQDLAPGQI
ncbi:MAG TPA: heme-binding protein [Aliidongia sp.]|nr:heme-binding protein [Aliidongia sp.]